ncbi:leucyl/phenylalanyl-tRNA--protein transferase [Acidihalobacter prosperus]
MTSLPWLDPQYPEQPFPPVEQALREPDGLLAVGGDLHPLRLLNAYRHGIFPWYEEGQPVLWWSPDPRAVLFIREFRLHRSLRKRLRNAGMRVSLDRAFADVMRACALPRRGQPGTWITPAMLEAYVTLHRMGRAHSVEVWNGEGELTGGLYGLALGRVFFGESMFSLRPDASKIALATLACQLQRWGFDMIDCQQTTLHLVSLGAREIPREAFVERLARDCELPGHAGSWRLDENLNVDRWQPADRS